MNITVGYWKTRGGGKARVLCTDATECQQPLHGYLVNASKITHFASWWPDGGESLTGNVSFHDLISPWVDAPVVDWSREREWVRAIARDEDGDWNRYDSVPVADEHLPMWVSQTCVTQLMHPSECPQFTGDWKDSLCVRPEGGAL